MLPREIKTYVDTNIYRWMFIAVLFVIETGNPMDREAWWVTVQGVTKSWIWLSTHTHMWNLSIKSDIWWTFQNVSRLPSLMNIPKCIKITIIIISANKWQSHCPRSSSLGHSDAMFTFWYSFLTVEFSHSNTTKLFLIDGKGRREKRIP